MLVKGTCKFCKQVFMVSEEDPDYISGGRNLDKIATLRCTCEESRDYQYREAQKERAYDNIDLAFNDYTTMKDALRAAVQGMVDQKLLSVTMKNGEGVTGKLTVTSKGTIKVSKTVSKKVEFDE